MQRFKLTKQHITLLRHANVDFEEHFEFGAPWINPKRPYGNSDVYRDIAKILKIKTHIKREGELYEEIDYTDKQYATMQKLHEETAIALQIILCTGKFKTGTYVADDYSNDWRLKRK